MAKYANLVEYNIKTSLDASGITKLQSELTKVQTTLNSLAGSPKKMKSLGLNIDEVQLYQDQIQKLEQSISTCFNSRTGMLNLNKFNSALKSGVLDATELNGAFKAAGAQGKSAFNSMVTMMTNVNRQAVTVNSTMAKIANTFSNTVRWGITASIFQEMMSSVQGAVSYMKNLDESLTQIQMVTNSSKENMRELAQYANNAAQALGSTTVDYTNAVKVFVQEGFSESESKQYANLSTKLANVSEQSTAVTSDQITAFRNAFQLDYEQTVAAMDKVANVANNTASNVNELMTASQRAASVAQAVGASQDSFLASIATIESVTRQSAEEIGNGLKTIYQRFADIKVSGGSTEDGVDYGQYAKALKQIGVDVLDAQGEFKGMDQILKETQEVWSSLSETMKVAVGEKVAGKFQYNRFAALMNNQAYYEKALAATGAGSEGMMDQMNEIYMDSIEGRLKTLQAAGEQVMSTLFNQDTVEPIIEDVTKFVNGLNDIIEIAGGGIPIFTALSALLLKIFSPQIAAQMTQIATNMATITQASNNMKNMNTAMMMAGQMGRGMNSKTYDVASRGMSVVQGLDQAAQQKVSAMVQQMAEAEERVEAAESKINEIASQLVTKYERQLNLTQEEAAELQTVLVNSIKNNESQDQIRASVGETLGLQEEQVEVIKLSRAEVNSMTQAYKEMNSATLSVNQNLNAANTSIQGFKSEQIAKGFTQALSAVTSLAFGIQSITSWLSTMNDETASFEEKLNATLISWTMGLSMLGSALTSLKGSWQDIVTGLGITEKAIALEGVKKASVEVTAAYEVYQKALVSGTEKEHIDALAHYENAIATKQEAIAKAEAVGATEANSKANLKNVLATAEESLAKKLNTEITIKSSLANKIYAASLKAMGVSGVEAAAGVTTLGSAIAAFALPVIAVAELIGLLVLSYKAWEEAIHVANKQYEQQTEMLKDVKESYKTAQESVDQLKNSIDSLSKKQEALDGLAEGTKEWKEAVRELNEEVLTLVENYPELLDKVSNDNGVLTIESEDLDNFYQKQVANLSTLRDASTIQQARVLSAENNREIENFSNQWGISKDQIRTAISEGNVKLSESNLELNKAFANLTNTIDKNTAAIESTTQQIGVLGDFVNYAGSKDLDVNNDYSKAKKEVLERYGASTEGDFGYRNPNFADFVSDANFKEEMSKALGATVVSAVKDGGSIKFELSNGNTETLDNEKILDKLSLIQTSVNEEQSLVESNRLIYGNFGVTWDNEMKHFVDANKNVINSLSELTTVTDEQREILEKLTDSTYNDYMSTLYDSTGKFAKKIKDGSLLSSSTFADQEAGLDAFLNNESFKEGINKELDINTIEEFTQAVKDGTINLDGLSESLKKLTPETVDLTTNINGNKFTNRIDISSDEDSMKKLLDDSGMSQGAFNRMSRDAYEEEQGYYQQEKEALEELIAKKQEDGEVTEWEAKQINEFNAKIEDLDDAAKDTTAMILRMSNGVVKLRSNIEDISEVLTNEAFRGTTEWYEALDELDQGLSEVLNIDAGTLSDEFIESGDALDYARRMAEGDMSAIDDLRNAAAQDIVQNLTIQANTGEDIEVIRSELITELNRLQEDISAGKITVYSDLDTDPFIAKLNDMLQKGQISAEQASQILSSVGMDAKIDYITGKGSIPGIRYVLDLSNGQVAFRPEQYTIENADITFPVIRGAHYTGPAVQTANTAARNPNYTGGYSKNPTPKKSTPSKSPSSGSNKQPKNNQKKDKETSQWDYLTDITNDLDRAAAAMEKLAKLEDRLYGANRISQLKKLRTEYKNYIKLLQQEVKLAEGHAEELRGKNSAYDKKGNLTLSGYAYHAGINQVQFDKQKNIENGHEIEQGLLSRLNNSISDYNAHRNDDNAGWYEEEIKNNQKLYDDFMKTMSEYENTLGKIEDGQSAIQDYKEKIQDAADEIVDAIQQGIEDMIETIDNQRNFNKLYRDWMQGGNSYSHFDNDRRYYTEGLQGLLSPNANLNGKSLFDIQIKDLSDRITDAKNIFDKDSSDADNEKLSEQAAFENLQEATTNIMDSLNKMIDYYDSLLSTIEEASSKMDELIDDRLAEFDKLENYLDTRLDQLKLIFGDKSYEQQTQFYNQKIATNMEKMVSINAALEAKQVTVKTLEKLEETGKQLSTEERKELQDARDKVNELQEEQLNTETKLLQDIADKLRAQTSAEMTNLVNELFGGNDVEWLSQQWEIATRNSEKYYDDYNRAFEIQKLQLKFQKALNDNQNLSLAAQQKINDLANEYLTYLREKDKLSEYDVKHAQMQLDILQKQIALEEAKNNKSQMQLQRNAAGNYDFVYGADENAVNQATEALLAAQQEAYNLSKQMYLETYEAAYQAALQTRDMVVEIATDASLSVEERSERIQEILNGLNEYLSGSSVELSEISVNLYNSFVDAETMVLEENQGNLSAIFEQMRAESAALHSEIEGGVNTAAENIQDVINSTTSNIEGWMDGAGQIFSNSANDWQTAISSAFKAISENGKENLDSLQSKITDEDGTLDKIKVGLINSTNGINTYIGSIIGQIDERFSSSRDNTLEKVKSIDEKIKEASENIVGRGGYLEEFNKATTEALTAATDDYKTFTEDGINDAAEQLKDLNDATNTWKSDLALLNTVITNSATEMATWKGKITDAITESGKFITASNNIQAALEGDAIMASIASSAFDTLSGSANTLESSVQSMASTLENSYYSIAGAASTAAAAYSDMASAAYEAGNAAQWAANELANLSWYDPTQFDVSGAVNQVRNAIGNTASLIAQTVTSNFKARSKSSSINPLSKSAWGGAGLATGGYTGTWSDKGMDSKNGKLAILHQKELVLNAEDTKNMLSVVEVVRDIMSGINSLPSIGKTLGQSSLNNNTIEQRVEINATFPGVTEAIEIKQALEQIADNAYQVANRYKY